MKMKKLIVACAGLFVFLSCTESFEPKGPFDDHLVVFAILTTVKDTQFVRLYRTYDPPGFNPLEHTTDNAIMDANVSITTNNAVYQFSDTVIVRDDTSRYASDIRAYVAYQFPVVRGETYTLNIQTNSDENVNASLIVPPPATIELRNGTALQSPLAFRNSFFSLNTRLSAQTRGFQVRAFLEYDLMENGVFVPKREEIPTEAGNFVNCQNFRPVYTALKRRDAIQPEATIFNVVAYIATLAKIWTTYSPFDVRMKRVVFELTEFDPALYSYLNIANGFRDEFSIRTDEPDYSNIEGRHGIFGAMTKQSFTVILPDTTGVTLSCQVL